jgi:hypothetical protein
MDYTFIKPGEPGLNEILSGFKFEIFRDLNCQTIGEIVSFDSSNQTAKIKIKIQSTVNGDIVSHPLLLNCPCVILTGGKANLRLPITAGDSCLVLFNDRNIDNWYSNGQDNIPPTNEMHCLSDGIALVGIRNLQNCLTDFSNTEAGIVYDKGKVIISTTDAVVVYDKGKVLVSNSESSLTQDKGKISISTNKIDISNDVQTLKSLILSLIDALVALKTIPAAVGVQLTLDPTVISQLNTIKSNFGDLLK